MIWLIIFLATFLFFEIDTAGIAHQAALSIEPLNLEFAVPFPISINDQRLDALIQLAYSDVPRR